MKTQNTTHTPGPWESDGSGQIYTADQRLDIALVTHHPNTKMPEPEDLANARLIAAAPELLAALVKLVAFAAQYTGDGCNEAEGAVLDTAHANAEPLDNMVDTARTAIAKATGKGQQP